MRYRIVIEEQPRLNRWHGAIHIENTNGTEHVMAHASRDTEENLFLFLEDLIRSQMKVAKP